MSSRLIPDIEGRRDEFAEDGRAATVVELGTKQELIGGSNLDSVDDDWIG